MASSCGLAGFSPRRPQRIVLWLPTVPTWRGRRRILPCRLRRHPKTHLVHHSDGGGRRFLLRIHGNNGRALGSLRADPGSNFEATLIRINDLVCLRPASLKGKHLCDCGTGGRPLQGPAGAPAIISRSATRVFHRKTNQKGEFL